MFGWNGATVLFWCDVWYGDVPLFIYFPNLFAKAKSSDIVIVAPVQFELRRMLKFL
jgi:hypothetical protein